MTKPDEYTVCFFPEQNSYVRFSGGEHGMFGVVRVITYRCGQCGEHLSDTDLQKHFIEEKTRWARKVG